MKKRVMALVVAGILSAGALAACGKTGTENEKETETEVVKDTLPEEVKETVEQITGGGEAVVAVAEGTTVSNNLFSITLPEEAAGTFISQTTENGISIYEKEANEAGFGGFAFSVGAYDDASFYAGGFGKKLGELTTADGKIYDIVVDYPSDVQFDYEKYNEMPENYSRLYNGAEDIIATLTGLDGAVFVPGAGMKGEDLYGDILAKYVQAVEEGWDPMKLEEEDMSTMFGMLGEDALNRAGYIYYDVNLDGVEELFLGEIAEGDWKGVVYDVYTTVNHQTVHVASGWDRSRYYVAEGCCLVNEASGGAGMSEIDVYSLEAGSTELWPQMFIKYDIYENEDAPWFVSYGSDEEWEAISEEDYNLYLGYYDHYIRFDYHPLAEAANGIILR